MESDQVMRIPLGRPKFDQDEIDELIGVLQSGWVSRGPKCQELEGMIAAQLNDPEDLQVVTLSSCTAALHLALLALGIKKGDEVIVPDFTFPATALAVLHAGARPVFVDVDPVTYCMDPEAARRAVTKKTQAIIPVHLFGHPADMDPIMGIAQEAGAYVIEDAACALGALYKGRPCGTIGDIGCFSLHARKVITTGEGGILVTTYPEVASKIRTLSNFGISDTWGRQPGEAPAFQSIGFNYKMSDIQAAVGVAQVRKLEGILQERAALAGQWTQILQGLKGIKVPQAVGDVRHAWQAYVPVAQNQIREEDLRILAEGINMEVGHFGTYSCLEQPVFEAYGREECPVSRDLFYRTFSLPMPAGLSFEKKEVANG